MSSTEAGPTIIAMIASSYDPAPSDDTAAWVVATVASGPRPRTASVPAALRALRIPHRSRDGQRRRVLAAR